MIIAISLTLFFIQYLKNHIYNFYPIGSKTEGLTEVLKIALSDELIEYGHQLPKPLYVLN